MYWFNHLKLWFWQTRYGVSHMFTLHMQHSSHKENPVSYTLCKRQKNRLMNDTMFTYSVVITVHCFCPSDSVLPSRILNFRILGYNRFCFGSFFYCLFSCSFAWYLLYQFFFRSCLPFVFVCVINLSTWGMPGLWGFWINWTDPYWLVHQPIFSFLI